MHLKADGIYLDIDKLGGEKPQVLMYVRFAHGKRTLRWYPNWGDVLQLVSDSLGTERSNKGHLQDFFIVSLMGVLYEHLLRRETEQHVGLRPLTTKRTITDLITAINDTIRDAHGYKRTVANDDFLTDIPSCLLARQEVSDG